ncbi:MAG: polyprenyl synthetase family protein [Desulfopila sp.]
MYNINTLLYLVEDDIQHINATMVKDISMLEQRFESRLIEILRYGLLEGGKRFRPLLAVLASRLCGGCSTPQIYQLAIAFEYLHVATLFHDDVIDQAQNRRGKASVHAAYGLEAAILAGDFLHARSMEIIGTLGGTACLEVFCQATAALVDGEFLQLRNARNYNQSEREYYTTIEGKTAQLISAATEIGAIHSGAGKSRRKAMVGYGRNLGFAFQIVDDLLDYLGDEYETGKTVGNDLAEGKMTLPLILSLNSAEQQEQQKLRKILQDGDVRRHSFATVFELITKYDGFNDARKQAENCIGDALAQLKIFDDNNKDVEALKGLAQYALHRKK